MATFFSTQRTNDRASPPVLNPSSVRGKRITAYFEYISPAAGTPQIADVIELVTIPAGARVLGGQLVNDAGTALCTIQLGITGTVGKYSAALPINATPATTTAIANSVALNFGQVVAAGGETILGTIAGAAVAANQQLRGFIEYLLA